MLPMSNITSRAMGAGMDVKAIEQSVHQAQPNRGLPPRERILIAARDLFARHGIHVVGVEAIAEAADTNKMTLYRHFESKDLLVAEYLRGLATESNTLWDEIAAESPGDPLAQIHGWINRISHHKDGAGSDRESGCALAYAAIQMTDPKHPGRRVIDEHKRHQRQQLASLCCQSGLRAPELLADQLFLLVEGSRVTGEDAAAERPMDLKSLAESAIAAHRV